MAVVVGIKLYLTIEILIFGMLIDFSMIIPKYFKHSRNKIYSHFFCNFLIILLGLWNEYNNDNVLRDINIRQKPWLLRYSMFVINLYILLGAQFGSENSIIFYPAFEFFVFLRKNKENQGNMVHWLIKGDKIFMWSMYFLCKIHLIASFMLNNKHERYSKLGIMFVILLTNASIRLVIEFILDTYVRRERVLTTDKLSSAEYRRKRVQKFFRYEESGMNEDKYEYLISLLNSQESIESLGQIYPEVKWVMFGNRVFDITNLVHPGGQYIWDNLSAREVSRFFTGNHFFEDMDELKLTHVHQFTALNYLEKRYVGCIESTEIFMDKKNLYEIITEEARHNLDLSLSVGMDDSLYSRRERKEDKRNHREEEENLILEWSSFNWFITQKREISQSLSVYHFQSEDKCVVSQPIRLENLGKFFFVFFNNERFQHNFRHFTVVLSLTSSNVCWRDRIFRLIYDEKFEEVERVIPPPPPSEDLILVVRKTGQKGMTAIMEEVYEKFKSAEEYNSHSHAHFEEESISLISKDSDGRTKRHKDEMFYFQGPQGLGLNLNRFASGSTYCICQGTGELPFVDLLDFLLKKLIYKVLKRNSGVQIANQVTLWHEEYMKAFENDISFKFLIACRSVKESFALPLIDKIKSLQAKFGTETLLDDTICRSSKAVGDDERARYASIDFVNYYFNSQNLKEMIHRDDPRRILICGSSDFNKYMTQQLTDISDELKKKIYIV